MTTATATRTPADLAAAEVLASVQAAEDAARKALAALAAVETARPEEDGAIYYTRKALENTLRELASAWDEAPRFHQR
jgi:hypothetical protein